MASSGVYAPKMQLSAHDFSSLPYRWILSNGVEASEPLLVVIPFGPMSVTWSRLAL